MAMLVLELTGELTMRTVPEVKRTAMMMIQLSFMRTMLLTQAE